MELQSDFPLTWKYSPPQEYHDGNGQMGMLVELEDAATNKWKVRLDDGKDAFVSYKNLALVKQEKAFSPEMIVALVGLDDVALNGKIGVLGHKETSTDSSVS